MIAAVLAVMITATNAVVQLPPIVVEASRLDLTETEMPSAVHTLVESQIADSGCHDFAALLRQQAPEVHFCGLGAGNPALAQLSLRGYGEQGHGRVLVLVDGEKLNPPDLSAPNLGRIPLNAISRVEVLGGAHSVRHGDGASAGVINVITEPETDECKNYAEIRGGDCGRVGAAVGTRGGLVTEGVKYWADGAYDHSDGYRRNSGYDLWNLSGGLKKEWKNGTYLKTTAFYSDSDYRTPGGLTWEEWQYDRRATRNPNDYCWLATYGFGTVFRAQLNEENALKFSGNFSYRHQTAHAEDVRWYYVGHNRHDIYSYRGAAEWINTAELSGLENRFDAGVEYRYDRLAGEYVTRYLTPGCPSDSRELPFYDRATMDVFAQDELHFTDCLALEAGGRYSRAWAFNNLCSSRSRNDHCGAFEVALVANPTDDAKIYAKVARHFRNAALDEVPWGLNPATLDYRRQAMLKPECGYTTEVGFNWRPTEETKVGADGFITYLEDEILYDAGRSANVNYDSATLRRGVDVFASWERERVAGVSVGANWTKATFAGGDYSRNLIPMVPAATVSANVRYWLWDDCDVNGGYRYQTWMYSISDFDNDGREVDGYGIFRLGATYRPSFVSWLEGMTFSVSVENLLDEDYCDYATYGTSFYPAAGRTLVFTLRYEF